MEMCVLILDRSGAREALNAYFSMLFEDKALGCARISVRKIIVSVLVNGSGVERYVGYFKSTLAFIPCTL